MKVGDFFYLPRGRFYRIYRYIESISEKGTESIPVQNEPFYSSQEEARKRVYELNGWNYKPKKKL